MTFNELAYMQPTPADMLRMHTVQAGNHYQRHCKIGRIYLKWPERVVKLPSKTSEQKARAMARWIA